jgi:hypothetical protein
MKKKAEQIIPPPKQCDCGKTGVVTQIEIIVIRTGKKARGVFSEFQLNGSKDRILGPGYRFVSWLVFCGDCFYSQPNQKEILDENTDTEND